MGLEAITIDQVPIIERNRLQNSNDFLQHREDICNRETNTCQIKSEIQKNGAPQ